LRTYAAPYLGWKDLFDLIWVIKKFTFGIGVSLLIKDAFQNKCCVWTDPIWLGTRLFLMALIPVSNLLRRLDRAWARVEETLTVLVLILMVFVAGFQAFVRNLSLYEVGWASRMLFDIEWADSFLRKGTLWLAFLGASLATYYGRHIGIDILMRIAKPRLKFVMRALSNLMAAIITVGLVVSFSSAVNLNLTERPLEYDVLGEDGSMHVCDASRERIAELQMERPSLFCVVRSLLAIIQIPAETPGAVFQLIVPIMFAVVALRLFGRGVYSTLVAIGGETTVQVAQAQLAREADALSGSMDNDDPNAEDSRLASDNQSPSDERDRQDRGSETC